MSTYDLVMMTFTVLGGLALFIFGMNVMTEGLRLAAGTGLRALISKATSNRFMGLLMGTVLGLLVHSSATTVMLVGFVNAGLMTIIEAIPPVLGANLGTAISMQLISFRLGDYCYFAIAIGLIMVMASPSQKVKNIGRALMGFGLIFLGMNTMSGAIRPHREVFQHLLQNIHGETYLSIVIGVLVSTLFTGIIQSSGATIAMCFALIQAGVFTSIQPVYPIVLGAHIGTCATSLLGSIGANINARRTAFAHLTFNIITTIVAVILTSPILRLVAPPPDPGHADLAHVLVRQTANLHLVIMMLGTALFLPFVLLHAKLLRTIVRSNTPPPEPSFLDNSLLNCPEKSLYAVIQELQRATRICIGSFHLTLEIIFTDNKRDIQTVKINESVINEVKLAVKAYLVALNSRKLSSRQTLLAQSLNRCMADIERIGDHVDELCDITLRRHKDPKARLSREALEMLKELYESADKTLQAVAESFDPEREEYRTPAQTIFDARDEYVVKSMAIKTTFADKVVAHEFPAIVAVFFSEYVAAVDRIVRHCKTIALIEVQPHFWIKRKKLKRITGESPEFELPERVDPQEFLSKVHWESPHSQ